MDIGRAFGALFRDPRWISKTLIGGLLFFVPIFGWLAIYGFVTRNCRSVIRGMDDSLPEWSDFGGLMKDGLKVFGATFVWGVPALVVNSLSQGAEGGVSGLLALIAFILNLISALVGPAVLAHVAHEGSFSAGVNFGAVLATVRAGLGNYVLIFLLSIVLGLIAVLGLIGLIIGIVFTAFYAGVVFSHLSGQAFRLAQPEPTASLTAGPAPRF